MSAFGTTPFGTTAPWGGPGTLSIITAFAIGTNSIQVFFDKPPKWRDPLGYRDSRSAQLWQVRAVDPGDVPGERRPTREVFVGEVFLDVEDLTQITLRTAPTLEPGILYDVELLGPVEGRANCEDFAGPATFRVLAPLRERNERGSRYAALATYADYDLPYFGRDSNGQPVASPGYYTYNEAGDIVLSGAAESLRQRVLRRIQTNRGGFAHLPAYGVTDNKGRLARPAQVTDQAVRLQEQLQSEPDVEFASVVATITTSPRGTFVRYQVRVKPRALGEVSFAALVPV